MDLLFDLTPPYLLTLCVAITLLAGIVKGVVGFAMPMIMISVMGSLLPPELALAGLILPTLVTNGMQALRQGPAAAWVSVKRFRIFLLVGMVFMLMSAQLVSVLSVSVMLAIIGGPVAVFSSAQLLGWKGELPGGASTRLEVGLGAFAGFVGGLSGVWGPPVVAYLTALNTEKREQMRVQGVIYGLGALLLAVAHVGSGVLYPASALFSAVLVVPGVLGMWIGGLLQDHINQRLFRKVTLLVLFVTGLNLLRRAFFG